MHTTQKRSSLYTLSSPLWEAPVSPQQLLTWLGCACLPQPNTALHTTNFQARYILHLKKAAPDSGLDVDSSSGPAPSRASSNPLGQQETSEHKGSQLSRCPRHDGISSISRCGNEKDNRRILTAPPEPLAPVRVRPALKDADLLRTLQWEQRGEQRGSAKVGEGGAATLYGKRLSSLPPRALQLIHSHGHKERQTAGGW